MLRGACREGLVRNGCDLAVTKISVERGAEEFHCYGGSLLKPLETPSYKQKKPLRTKMLNLVRWEVSHLCLLKKSFTLGGCNANWVGRAGGSEETNLQTSPAQGKGSHEELGYFWGLHCPSVPLCCCSLVLGFAFCGLWITGLSCSRSLLCLAGDSLEILQQTPGLCKPGPACWVQMCSEGCSAQPGLFRYCLHCAALAVNECCSENCCFWLGS